jgi:hypothetical protein
LGVKNYDLSNSSLNICCSLVLNLHKKVCIFPTYILIASVTKHLVHHKVTDRCHLFQKYVGSWLLLLVVLIDRTVMVEDLAYGSRLIHSRGTINLLLKGYIMSTYDWFSSVFVVSGLGKRLLDVRSK